MQMPAYFHRFSFAPANVVHQPATMHYDIMTKNKEKKGLRRGMENGGKKMIFLSHQPNCIFPYPGNSPSLSS